MRLPVVSHRRSTQSGFTRGVRVTVVSAAAATAAATLTAAPASADPKETRESAKAAVDRLYEEAERATERFNEAGERVDRLRGEADRALDATARGQDRVNRMRDELGAMAGAQYRTGAIDPSLALLLSGDPDTYLERAAALDRAGARQAITLDKLRHAQRTMAQNRAEATRALSDLEHSRTAVARHKRAVEGKLREARSARVPRFPRTAPPSTGPPVPAATPRPTSPDSAPPPGARCPPSPPSTRPSALRLGRQRPLRIRLFRPDAVGLRPGRGEPAPHLPGPALRFSRMVPLSQAQPGDLVAYRADASHIGMYVGNGQVIHAPYPGAAVRYDPVGMMPVSSVTRI